MSKTENKIAVGTVTEYVNAIAREWRVMVKDPLWKVYGGVDTTARRTAYMLCRLQELRTACTPYLHRASYCELAYALDDEVHRMRVA